MLEKSSLSDLKLAIAKQLIQENDERLIGTKADFDFKVWCYDPPRFGYTDEYTDESQKLAGIEYWNIAIELLPASKGIGLRARLLARLGGGSSLENGNVDTTYDNERNLNTAGIEADKKKKHLFKISQAKVEKFELKIEMLTDCMEDYLPSYEER